MTPDDVSAAAMAAGYLYDRGSTRLAVIGARDVYDEEALLNAAEGNAQLRLRGIIEETRRRGLSLDPQLIGNTDQDWTIGAGARVTQRLIDSGVPFDGVIALNDQLAIGALTALRTAGYEVPVQVQVIGFDNNEERPLPADSADHHGFPPWLDGSHGSGSHPRTHRRQHHQVRTAHHRIPGHRPRLHTLNDIAVMLVLLYWAVRGVDTPVDQHGIKC